MFPPLRALRRRRLRQQPFPPAWEEHVRRRLPFATAYDAATAQRFRERLQVFIGEKQWEGVGLDVTDEMRVVIAGVAARLSVNLDNDDVYDAVDSIVVRPTSIRRDDGRILGLVHRFGTVVLAWDAVKQGLVDDDDGHDTALHEFAHALDLADGDFDGTPTLADRAACRAWASVCARRFGQLRDGSLAVLREYGATNEAEFFAVACEAFFEKPRALRRKAPDLYRLLADFFRQDPAGDCA